MYLYDYMCIFHPVTWLSEKPKIAVRVMEVELTVGDLTLSLTRETAQLLYGALSDLFLFRWEADGLARPQGGEKPDFSRVNADASRQRKKLLWVDKGTSYRRGHNAISKKAIYAVEQTLKGHTLNLKEISDAVGLAQSTIRNILSYLAQEKRVVRDKEENYSLAEPPA